MDFITRHSQLQKKPISHFLGELWNENMFYTIFFDNYLCIKILINVTVLLKPVYAVRQCLGKGSFLKMTSFRQLVPSSSRLNQFTLSNN